MNKRSELGNFLNLHGLVGVGAEVGVHTGEFAKEILEHWNGERLYLVDPWSFQPDYLDSWGGSDLVMSERLEIARDRMSPFSARVTFIIERSDAAVRQFPDEFFDFVYIDANHAFAHVTQDLSLWYPKLRGGGLFAGHDFFDAVADHEFEPVLVETPMSPNALTSYGVKSAVTKFAAENDIDIQLTNEDWPTWYFFKPLGDGALQ